MERLLEKGMLFEKTSASILFFPFNVTAKHSFYLLRSFHVTKTRRLLLIIQKFI
jgi:hypothetical protein